MIPKEGRPPFGNWVRESAHKSTNILSMFSSVPGLPGRPSLAKKRKNDFVDILPAKSSKVAHHDSLQSQVPSSSVTFDATSVTTIQNTAETAAKYALSLATGEFKSMLKQTQVESNEKLRLVSAQYLRKLDDQRQQFENCLKQLQVLTSDARAQRLLDQKREIIRLKQLAAMQSDKHFVFDSTLSRCWCMLCRKWIATGLIKAIGNPKKLHLISDEGLDMIKNRRTSEMNKHSSSRVFERHKETKMHKDALAFEKNNIQLDNMWNPKSKSDTHVLELLHKLLYRLKKENLSQLSYERWIGFLDFIGVYVGEKFHSDDAARFILFNISDALYEQEQRFMVTTRPQTNRSPFFGHTGDEVSVHGRTFDLQQVQVVEAGRPKQLHVKTVEIKALSATGKALFEASDKELRRYTNLCPDKNHVLKVLVGGCFDGASPYQAAGESVTAYRVAKNSFYRGKHDRMHKQNLAFKLMMKDKKLQPLAKVLQDYKKITKYFGNSTKKLRMLKEIEIDLDVFLKMDEVEKNVTRELKKLASKSNEANQLLSILSSQEKIELELESSEVQIEAAILHDERLKSIHEKLEELDEQMEKLETKRGVAETKAKEVAEVRVRAHKLTRIYEIRMVNGIHKSLKMLYRRYHALCIFIKNEVDLKEKGALRVYRILTSFHWVCRFLCMMDITEALTKSLCLEQIGSVTVLHLEALNRRLFASLDKLADTDIRKHDTFRFGDYLAKHGINLDKQNPEFKKISLIVTGRRNKRDRLSPIRNLQNRACKFLRKAMEERMSLDEYSIACQALVPHNCNSDSDESLASKLDIIIDANIEFIGGVVHRRNVEIGLRKLIKMFERREFKDFTDLQVLDAYELIWNEGRFYRDLGPETMALIECVLVDPHSSANCERAGSKLKRILAPCRKSLQEAVVDGEMRICMNGPHESNITWSFLSNRWFNVLSKSSPIARDVRNRGLGGSQVVAKQIKEATAKAQQNLQCSFYTTIPPRQKATDSNV